MEEEAWIITGDIDFLLACLPLVKMPTQPVAVSLAPPPPDMMSQIKTKDKLASPTGLEGNPMLKACGSIFRLPSLVSR